MALGLMHATVVCTNCIVAALTRSLPGFAWYWSRTARLMVSPDMLSRATEPVWSPMRAEPDDVVWGVGSVRAGDSDSWTSSVLAIKRQPRPCMVWSSAARAHYRRLLCGRP